MKKIFTASLFILAMFISKSYAADSLIISVDEALSSMPRYIPVGSTSGVSEASKTTFFIMATGNPVTITELKCYVSGGNTITTIRIGSTTVPVVGSVAYFSNLNILVPASKAGIHVDAYISYPPVNAGGVASGVTSRINLLSAKCLMNNNTSKIIMSEPLSVPLMTLVASTPIVSVLWGDQGILTLGAENKIADISISANSMGKISIGKIRLTVRNDGFTGRPKFSNIRLTDGSKTITGVKFIDSASVTDNHILTIDCIFSTEFLISAGQTQSFNLFATINGVTNSVKQYIMTNLISKYFLWTDVEGGGLPSAENGIFIQNFPPWGYVINGQTATAVEDISSQSRLRVYPNPLTEYCIFDFSDMESHIVSLYDITGREIETLKVVGEVKINRDNMPAGIYLYKIYSENGQLSDSGKMIAE